MLRGGGKRRGLGILELGGAVSAQGLQYIVQVYSIMGFIALVTFGAIHIWVERSPIVGQLEILCGLVLAVNALGLRVTRNAVLARNFFLATILTALLVMLITGGTRGTGIFWMFTFPVCAFFLAGKRRGLWWMAGLVGMIAGVVLLNQGGVVTMPYSLIEIRQLVISVLVVGIGIYIYQLSRETLETKTHQSRRALQEAKIRADTILENIDEGVVAVDAAGRVAHMNQAAAQVLGLRHDELAGKRFVEAVTLLDEQGNSLDVSDQPLRQTLQHVMTFKGNYRCARRGGHTIPLAVSSRSVVIDGKIVGAIGTFRDTSEERAVDRAKSEFVTLASHQLRTPISTIAWLSEMLLHDDAGKLTAEQRKYISQVYTSNKRSAAMVDAMLLASSLEINSVDVTPVKVDVPALAHKELTEQQTALPIAKTLHITEDYDPELPPIPLDPQLTRAVLQNLLSNAIKYTPKGGHISVTIKKTHRKLYSESKGSIVIEVADTGYGIPKGQQQKIFAKLFRASNIKIKDTDGTGLGLYIVKMILQQVGGQIRFTSTENKGTTFTVVLPLEGMTRRSHAALQRGESGV